jgi:hypothetical protein
MRTYQKSPLGASLLVASLVFALKVKVRLGLDQEPDLCGLTD